MLKARTGYQTVIDYKRLIYKYRIRQVMRKCIPSVSF